MTEPTLPPQEIYYPESLRSLGADLSFLVTEERHEPGVFNAMAPTAITRIVDFFESIQVMHARAAAVLDERVHHGRPYCLYLRAFSSGGMLGKLKADGEGVKQQLMLHGDDASLRRHLSESLAGLMPVVSCFNTLDLYSTPDAADPATAPAILRLLSHNWPSQIQALIDGAHFVVLLPRSRVNEKATEGVNFEMGSIHALGQKDRCIFLLDTPRANGPVDGFDVHAAFAWPFGLADWSTAPGPRAFADCARSLATDGHMRRRKHPALVTPPCFVIDKGYDPSQFASGELTEAEYPILIPETLQANAEGLERAFPPIWRWWNDVEGRLQSAEAVSREELQDVMFDALSCFVLATTLENYWTMARCLVAVGVAHRALSQSNEFARICANGAAKFAHRADRPDLAARYAAIAQQLAP